MTSQNILFQDGVTVATVQDLPRLNHLQLSGIAILQGKKTTISKPKGYKVHI